MRKFFVWIFIFFSLIFILTLSFSQASALAPPAWIEGDWSSEYNLTTFVFKAVDVIMGKDIIKISLQESFPGAEIQEDISEQNYTISFLMNGVSTSFEFVKISDDKLDYYNNTAGFRVGPQRLYLNQRSGEPVVKSVDENHPENNGSSNEYFAGGTGTASDPYLIENAEQLNNIRYHMDKNFKQISDINLAFFRLDKGWVPLNGLKEAYWENFFTGTYDGSGFNIYNLNMNKNESKIGVAIGIFDTVGHDGVIKNLNIKNVDIYSNTSAAAIAGLNYGDILNCSAEGNISGDGSYIGGIAGTNTEGGRILESYFEGNIQGNFSVGGLAGNNSSGAVIRDSYFHGTVLGNDRVGGIVGGNGNSALIENCYMVGNVGGDNAGEISGNTSVESNYETFIINCYHLEKVKEKSYFEGWDFTTTWGIIDGLTYPYLRSGGRIFTNNWQMNSNNIEPSQSLEFAYQLTNKSNEIKRNIVTPILVRPDGHRVVDISSISLSLNPGESRWLEWEYYPFMSGGWDVGYLVWDLAVRDQILDSLFSGEDILTNVMRLVMMDSLEHTVGPYSNLIQVGGEEYIHLRAYLNRTKKHIFKDFVQPRRDTWSERLVGKLSHADEIYTEAVNRHEDAKKNWSLAQDYLNANNYEAAFSFLNIAIENNYQSYSILHDSTEVFIKSAERGMITTKAINKINYEVGKFVALLYFGQPGYRAAKKLSLAGGFLLDGFADDWSGASKKIATKVITEVLIKESKILDALKVDGMLTDAEILNRLIDTLSKEELAKKIAWEFTVSNVVAETTAPGVRKMIEMTLDETSVWLEEIYLD